VKIYFEYSIEILIATVGVQRMPLFHLDTVIV